MGASSASVAAKSIYGVTAAVLGILLWCWVLLDLVGYETFVLSLSWLPQGGR